LPSYDLSPPLPPPSIFLSLPVCRWSSLLTGEGEGGGGGEKVWSSIIIQYFLQGTDLEHSLHLVPATQDPGGDCTRLHKAILNLDSVKKYFSVLFASSTSTF
jgi:hypothetical protein